MSKTKKPEPENEKPEQAESKPTADEARQILLQEQEATTRACMQEVDNVLRKHGCALDVSMTVTTRGVTPRITIIPAPPRQ
jgi:hypothetical protein